MQAPPKRVAALATTEDVELTRVAALATAEGVALTRVAALATSEDVEFTRVAPLAATEDVALTRVAALATAEDASPAYGTVARLTVCTDLVSAPAFDVGGRATSPQFRLKWPVVGGTMAADTLPPALASVWASGASDDNRETSLEVTSGFAGATDRGVLKRDIGFAAGAVPFMLPPPDAIVAVPIAAVPNAAVPNAADETSVALFFAPTASLPGCDKRPGNLRTAKGEGSKYVSSSSSSSLSCVPVSPGRF